MKSIKLDNFEAARQKALISFEEMNGPTQPEEINATSANQYQAQQLAEITSENLKTFLMYNPLILSDPNLFRLGMQAIDALEALGESLAARQ